MNIPTKWPQLIKTTNQIIPTIKTIPNYENNVKISVLTLSNDCKIHQENVSPNTVNFNSIKPRFGGTNFSSAFQTAYTLMTKYINDSMIVFIFLTDGESSLPKN